MLKEIFEDKKLRKEIINKVKKADSIVLLTEDSVSGNASPMQIRNMIASSLNCFYQVGIFSKKDLDTISKYVVETDKDKKEKLLDSLISADKFDVENLIKKLSEIDEEIDEKDDEVQFVPKKKRGRPRKNV